MGKIRIAHTKMPVDSIPSPEFWVENFGGETRI
ncbi:hypothetical protein FUAX_01990 [Fulvitalea axinellae]|uniref:Uncharacterized protein n=1 Tax=Fulvitalea axinellae TaxID=1182444 RepID=A0AAU9CIT6_9BACT|nr:hypothetical protein FUAX_01990 [Fulvitalea axinellae]